jgi:ferredoxin
MIIADRKPLEEIQEMIKDADNIMLVGCKGCVTVCNAGGLKEVEILASTLRIARKKEGRPLKIEEKSCWNVSVIPSTWNNCGTVSTNTTPC